MAVPDHPVVTNPVHCAPRGLQLWLRSQGSVLSHTIETRRASLPTDPASGELAHSAGPRVLGSPSATLRPRTARSVGGGSGQAEQLAESIHAHVPTLHIGNRLAPENLVLSGELTGAGLGSDGHHDADAHGLIVGEV